MKPLNMKRAFFWMFVGATVWTGIIVALCHYIPDPQIPELPTVQSHGQQASLRT